MTNESRTSGIAVASEIQGEPIFNQDQLVLKIIDEINKQPGKLTELARASVDSRHVLDENLRALGMGHEEFTVRNKLFLEELRQGRMTTVTECAKLTSALKDVRQFFIGNDYEREIGRLREFVELCERLQKLKDSGFLDAVSDTMLRLSEKG